MNNCTEDEAQHECIKEHPKLFHPDINIDSF